MTTTEVSVVVGHPNPVMVLVMVYVPAAEESTLISPVFGFKNTNPAGEDVNNPALAKESKIGAGTVPPAQNVNEG
jgi:hypothetical protein